MNKICYSSNFITTLTFNFKIHILNCDSFLLSKQDKEFQFLIFHSQQFNIMSGNVSNISDRLKGFDAPTVKDITILINLDHSKL